MSNVTHTLLMRDVVPEDAGSYSCRVENSAGDLTSPLATLTVRPQQEFEGDCSVYHKILSYCTLYAMQCNATQRNW